MNKDGIRNYFSLPVNEAKKVRGEVIVIDRPIGEDVTTTPCPICTGLDEAFSGICIFCAGKGNRIIDGESIECIGCNGGGKCDICAGFGDVEYEL